MKSNIGNLDRILRWVLALLVAILILTDSVKGVWLYSAGIICVILLLTASMKYCPLYQLIGFSTCSVKK